MPDNQPPFRERNHGWWEIRITPKEVYDSVQKLKGSIDAALHQFATLKGEIENVRDDVKENKTRLDATLNDHENRLRFLEKGRWPLASVTVLLAAGALLLGVINLFANAPK